MVQQLNNIGKLCSHRHYIFTASMHNLKMIIRNREIDFQTFNDTSGMSKQYPWYPLSKIEDQLRTGPYIQKLKSIIRVSFVAGDVMRNGEK
jgi:hypothetical protein